MREHGVSPYRYALDKMAEVFAGRGSSETVTLKINAKQEMQPEVTAVRQDGETLLEAYARAASVLRVAKADFDPPEGSESFQGVPAYAEEEIPF